MTGLLQLDANGAAVVVDDAWQWIEDPAATCAALPAGPVIVPLALWQGERDALKARSEVAVWLAPDDEPETIADDLDLLPLIGLHFPVFTDGRCLSTAAILRTRLGYRRQLRALGDVQRDQLAPMRRCGIDAFRLRPDLDPARAAAGLTLADHPYQGDVLDPRPLYRRVRREAEPRADAA